MSRWNLSCWTISTVATLLVGLPAMLRAADDTWSSTPAAANGPIVLKAVAVVDEDENPAAAGKAAAAALKKAMGSTPLKAVLVSECFEDQENKQKLLRAVTAELPEQIVFGESTYGSFVQAGPAGADSVCLLGIGGDGIGITAALVTDLGTSKLLVETDREAIQKRLNVAGGKLAQKIPKTDRDRLLVLLADAHSPKNQFLVEGLQQVVGKRFPITGGCANKNSGQTFVYFGGRMHADSALALMLSGDFHVSLAGRQAKDNDGVIATAEQAAATALGGLQGKPLGALAFDCAGRKGKLKRLSDELQAVQRALGKDLTVFGCYCAGEIGPLDIPDKPADTLSGGGGWHVMFTVLGR